MIQFFKKFFIFFLIISCLIPTTSTITLGQNINNLIVPRNFIITAYYSPLPGQKSYVTGSYIGDIALNGRGTNGASGMEVFPGMLAAPKTYDFKIKIKLEGLGVGMVADRGGAIIPASKNGFRYDRIDIWMGYGDDGRIRAMTWGKREVKGEILGFTDDDIDLDWSNLRDNTGLEKIPESNKEPEPLIVDNEKVINLNLSEDDIKDTQRKLALLNYHSGSLNGIYDLDTLKSIINFQKVNKLENTSGYLDEESKTKLYDKWEEYINQNGLKKEMKQGDQLPDVKIVKLVLKREGSYNGEIDNIYSLDLTNGVKKLQEIYNIIEEQKKFQNGGIGKKTLEVINELIYK